MTKPTSKAAAPATTSSEAVDALTTNPSKFLPPKDTTTETVRQDKNPFWQIF